MPLITNFKSSSLNEFLFWRKFFVSSTAHDFLHEIQYFGCENVPFFIPNVSTHHFADEGWASQLAYGKGKRMRILSSMPVPFSHPFSLLLSGVAWRVGRNEWALQYILPRKPHWSWLAINSFMQSLSRIAAGNVWTGKFFYTDLNTERMHYCSVFIYPLWKLMEFCICL